MKKTSFFITLFLAFFFASCARIIVEFSVIQNGDPPPDEEKIADNAIIKDNTSLSSPTLEQFFTANIPYNWISYRARMNFRLEGSNYNFQIFYVNRIDSVIYININILGGIELARLVATPEEIIFVNKMNKEYYQGDYQFLSSMIDFPVNFYMVQALLNGTDFKDFSSNFLLLSQETDLQWRSTKRCHKSDNICFQHFLIFNNNLQLQKNHLEIEHPKRVFVIEYQNYTKSEFLFFNNFSIEVSHISLKGSGELRNIRFNTPCTTSIKIPDNFTPIKH